MTIVLKKKDLIELLVRELNKLDSALTVLINEHTTIYNNTSSRVFQSIGRCEVYCAELELNDLKTSIANIAASLYNMYDGINYDAAIEDLKQLKEQIKISL